MVGDLTDFAFACLLQKQIELNVIWPNGCVSRKGGRAMAATMASSQKVRRQKILKIFLPECSCRTERAVVRSPV